MKTFEDKPPICVFSGGGKMRELTQRLKTEYQMLVGNLRKSNKTLVSSLLTGLVDISDFVNFSWDPENLAIAVFSALN